MTCSSPAVNNSFGWRIALPGTNEQVIFSPTLLDGFFQIATYIPSPVSPLSCTAPPPAGGFSMAITPDQGVAPSNSYFSNAINNQDAQLGTVVGIGLGAVGTPAHVQVNGRTYTYTQTSAGTPFIFKDNLPPTKLTRVSWRQLR